MIPTQVIQTLLWLIPLPPILAFGIIALGVNRSRMLTTLTSMTGILISLAASWVVVLGAIGAPELGRKPIGSSIEWLATGATTLRIGAAVDALGATFLFMVPLACAVIFLYSTSYMASDPRYTRFMGYLSLFAGSMLGLVVADNLLSLFVFWELMGFCSYSLIGFFYAKPSAYKASVKAFMTTRIGDMLLLLGIVYLYAETGTLNFADILVNKGMLEFLADRPAILLGGMGISAASMIALLIFGGTVGKSAQFPLHVWLPDAMEGPTPVSAMIHAATMVSAGIFLLLRFFPLFEEATHGPMGSRTALEIVGMIGAITALMGALIAVAQYDIKRVLAYSTISQLGFMVAAVGMGAYVAAAFHLLTHAFFKALLFLGSGSVIHGVEHGHHHLHGDDHGGHADPAGQDDHGGHDDHSKPPAFDPQDMRNMGGLAQRMPLTTLTFVLGGMALSGFPFITAGFWSKDEILADAFAGMASGKWLHSVIFIVLCVAATLTAFYTMRQIALTFLGEARSEAAAHAVENPWQMTLPLVILAFFAAFLGFINIPRDFPVFGPLLGANAAWLKDFLGQMLLEKEAALPFNIIPVLASVGIAFTGLGLGALVYAAKPLKAGQTDPVEKLGPVYAFLRNRMYFDELYRAVFINPLQWIADHYTAIVDRGIIDSLLEIGYTIGGGVAEGFRLFDKYVVTGASDLTGSIFKRAGEWVRELQTGQVQNYLLTGIALAAVLVAFYLFIFQG
ncbi:MAG: NADH-quinone oxidoreductase subunit L [Thermoflexales bacterium]